MAFLVVGFHEVGARQIFIRAEYADEILTLDIHELRQSRARADKYGIKAVFFEKLFDFAGAADDIVEFDFYAESLEIVDLVLNDRFGEAEFGNSVNENAARFVKGFEHRDVVTGFRTVGGACDRCGARADYGDTIAR